LGTISKALKKSHLGFENRQNTLDSIHHKILSGSDRKDTFDTGIETMHKNCNLMVATGLKALSNEVEQSLRLKNCVFPEEYQKKIR